MARRGRATAPSLTLAPTPDAPFVSYLDPDGYLWLDEYARWPVSQGLKVLDEQRGSTARGPAFVATASGTITYNAVRTFTIAAGIATAYRFDSAGKVIATISSAVGATSRAHYSTRSVIGGQSYLAVQDGTFAGYQLPLGGRVAETPGHAAVVTPVGTVTYLRQRTVTVQPGSYTAYQFGPHGDVVSSRTVGIGSASSAHFTARSLRDGIPYLAIDDGAWSGYLLPETAGVSDDDPVADGDPGRGYLRRVSIRA